MYIGASHIVDRPDVARTAYPAKPLPFSAECSVNEMNAIARSGIDAPQWKYWLTT
jgi:hypothetical protein